MKKSKQQPVSPARPREPRLKQIKDGKQLAAGSGGDPCNNVMKHNY